MDVGIYVIKLAVVGVGNIGIRYVQGILRKFPDSNLYVVDRASRLDQIKAMELGEIRYATSLNDISDRMDLFVVATSCESRLELYRRCLELDPKYIVLEKHLFKSRAELAESISISHVPTYVNQWMFGTKIFNSLINESVRSVVVEGSNWGLACNSVHWIDLIKRGLGISSLQVGRRSSISEVFASKRADYEEVNGDWIFEDTDSTKMFRLIDSVGDGPSLGLTIKVDGEDHYFDHKTVSKNGNIISHFPYFSDQIGGIVDELLNSGVCCLPTLAESVSQHLLVEDILDLLTRRPKIT